MSPVLYEHFGRGRELGNYNLMLVWDHKLDHTILLGGKGAAGEVDARFVEVTGYPNGGISSHFPVQEPEQEGEGRKTRSVF